jgi:uncharacterized protein YdaT
MPKRKLSKKAQSFISRKIKKLIDEGYSQKQAVAIAYSYARKRGFRVPKKRK